MGQTLAVSAIVDLAEGDAVNLERAAKVGDRLGGHIVQGHVDGVARLLEIRDEGSWRVLRFSLPDDLAPLVVDKGSIAIAGTSLTVSAVGAGGRRALVRGEPDPGDARRHDPRARSPSAPA